MNEEEYQCHTCYATVPPKCKQCLLADAAADLLAACEAALIFMIDSSGDNMPLKSNALFNAQDTVKQLQEAIKKAKGEA